MSVMRMDFISEITTLINNSGLPSFVIEPIIKDILNELRIATQKQYELDKVAYEKMLNTTKGDFVDDTRI